MTAQDTQPITFRLPRDMYEWLRQAAFDRRTAMAALVTQALIEKRARMEASDDLQQ